jgi:N-acetylmuramoyl-L-alanine amidase
MKVIALLPGHGSKPDAWDPGARSPAGWDEADLVRRVAASAFVALQLARVPAEIVAAGSYTQRGQDADAGAGASLIVQLHADASAAEIGPDVGRVFYWPRNQGALVAAKALALELAKALPWPVLVVAADERWPNARACLGAVKGSSVLLELGFTDGPLGRVELPLRVQAMGEAVARALAGG